MDDSRALRRWYVEDDGEAETNITLVHAPLTFGHSQLVIKFLTTGPDESSRFEYAAKIVPRALRVFRRVLIASTLDKFERLARLTMTEGNYVKTLILRSSAQEECTEYKIHLVPYFESHAVACQRRYASLHSESCNQTGGLLGWLGDRETIVDCWQNEEDHPFEGKLDDIAVTSLKMDELAELLRQKWPQG